MHVVPSGVPVNVSAVAVTPRTIQVAWDPLLTHERNGLVLYYVVMVTVEQTHFTFTLNVTSTSISIPDLHPSYSYSIEVAAVTINVGPFSEPLIVTTPDDGELVN